MKKLSLILVFVTLGGCSFKHTHTTAQQQQENYFTVDSNSIGYAEIKNQIISPSCLNCHSGRHEPSLTNYQEVKEALSDIKNSVLIEKSMPKRRPLSLELRSILNAWIVNGAPEFAIDPAGSPSPTPALPPLTRPVLFSAFKARVLDPSCVSCHQQGNKEGLTSMEDYQSVKSVVDLLSPLMTGKMGDVVVPDDQKMPPPKSPAMTNDQLDVLKWWLEDGAKEN